MLKTVAFIFISPLLGFVLGSLLHAARVVDVSCARRRAASTAGSGACSSSRRRLYSLGHGGNDAQKTIGIIWMLLIATGYRGADRSTPPVWVIVGCYCRDRPGHAVRRLAHRARRWASSITKLKPVGGFCAETGGAITLFLATALGIPVSTTHTITGAIVGVGATQKCQRGALGRRGQHRLGVDPDDSGVGRTRGRRLVVRPPLPVVALSGAAQMSGADTPSIGMIAPDT